MSRRDRAVSIHSSSSPRVDMLPLQSLADEQGMRFPPECLGKCARLVALLNSSIPNGARPRSVYSRKLNAAENCSGPQRKMLGGMSCKTL